MFRYTAAFILSLVVSNWLYAEFLLLVPEAEPAISKLSYQLSIPTHDQWEGIANNAQASKLSDSMRQDLSGSRLGNLFKNVGLTDSRVRSRHASRDLGRKVARISKPFLSGSDIFLDPNQITGIFGGYERFRF